MKALLIYNPNSGSNGFKSEIDYVIKRFQENNYKLSFIRIDEKTDLNEELKIFNEEKFEKVIVAGGDGTIHNSVNALIKNSMDVPINIFPIGTSNDYARYFNLPKDIKGMVGIALRDNHTKCDLGMAGHKAFINVASIGFVSNLTKKSKNPIKSNIGVLSYYLNAFEEIPKISPLMMS